MACHDVYVDIILSIIVLHVKKNKNYVFHIRIIKWQKNL